MSLWWWRYKKKVSIGPESETEVFDKLKYGVILGKLEQLEVKDALKDEDLKTGDDLTYDDKTNNADKVIDAADKLDCPTKVRPNDILRGKKKKDQDLTRDILSKIMVPPKLII